jgi:hypothetical protein
MARENQRNELKIAAEEKISKYEKWLNNDFITSEFLNARESFLEEYGERKSKNEIIEGLRCIRSVLMKLLCNFTQITEDELVKIQSVNLFYGFDESTEAISETLKIAECEYFLKTNHYYPFAKRMQKFHSHIWDIIEIKMEKRVSDSFQKAIRNYAFDNKAETVCFCRTTIELALKEKIDTHEESRDYLKTEPSLNSLMNFAKKRNMLGDKVDSVYKIKTNANKIIHDDTNIVKHYKCVFSETIDILKKLYTGYSHSEALHNFFKRIKQD